MGRRGRTISRSSGVAHARVKNMESEDSDEDYVAEVDEADEQSEDLDSLIKEASEEESCFEEVAEGVEEEEEVEEDEEEVKENDDDDDDDCDADDNDDGDDDDDDWRTVVKPKPRKVKVSGRTRKVNGTTRTVRTKGSATRKRSTRPRKNGVRRPKKRSRVMSDDDEDSEDDDSDDDEFTPDELDDEYTEEEEDFLEEEEEFSLWKNTRKRGRSNNKEETSVKRRQKRSSKTARKPHAKKRKKTNRLKRRTRSRDDENFEKGPKLRDRSRKKPDHRKKVVKDGSESDFCSDPSDYEFTISEEEREQIREANKICGSVATNMRSSRKNQEDEAFNEPTINVRKGKEKVEEKKNDVGKAVCGICFTEEGKNIVRGTLNCCSHYFCFACIFEWSKVETRCPLCKQRFISISKPARCVRGFDLRDTVIAVPERDQVYQPSEEELQDFFNPYENMMCMECHQGGDDALMLLCDLCDSPAHTYCVGLGHEVPEGNWYCEDCKPVAPISSHTQTQDLNLEQSSIGVSDGTSAYENMAEIDLNVTIPETPVSQGNGFLPSPRVSSGSIQAPSPSGMGVWTVSGRRLIHEHIRRHILSHRLSQISHGADVSDLGNQVGRGINSTQQHNRMTIVGPSHHTQYVERLQENPFHSVQNRESFPGRVAQMTRGVGQPSTSVNGFAHSQGQWSELNRMNMGASQSQIAINAQLRPCSSRSSVGPEIGASHSNHRFEEQASFLKQQVQSLVRNQMKSLPRDMNLGHTEYVEILRRSAYTILAAIGLEPPRHDTYMAQPPTCPHLESRLANIEMSPMNGCCLVCFEGFVKDVVNKMVNIVLQPHLFGFRH